MWVIPSPATTPATNPVSVMSPRTNLIDPCPSVSNRNRR